MPHPDFLLDKDTIFLNHGSFGACPRQVLDACHRWHVQIEQNPVQWLAYRSAALLDGVRTRLGEFLGASGDDLVLIPNATHGVNVIAHSLRLQPGDEVITTNHEYGACDLVWQAACERSGAIYRRISLPLPLDPGGFADALISAVSPRTRLIFTSHVTSATALILPIEQLCYKARKIGVLTLVDGAHAPGQIGLDIEAIAPDFYAGNCHKWCCGPKGTGFLWARPEHHDWLVSPIISWGYSPDNSAHCGYTGSKTLQRKLQWLGTRDLAPFLALSDAIEWVVTNCDPTTRSRLHAGAIELMHRGCRITGQSPVAQDSSFAQMVPIPIVTSDPASLKQRLYSEFSIEVPITEHEGQHFVRASMQVYNCGQDAQALLGALTELAKSC